jgi:hypothetical protein
MICHPASVFMVAMITPTADFFEAVSSEPIYGHSASSFNMPERSLGLVSFSFINNVGGRTFQVRHDVWLCVG